MTEATRGSLREQRKAQTRQALQAAAVRLFTERGYDETTTDDIAAAAGVSPRTFFRYFATKEDVVEWDAFDEVVDELVAARPAGEPPLVAVREVVLQLARGLTPEQERQVLDRVRLMFAVPALRARVLDAQLDWIDRAVPILARRTGRPTDDLGLHLAAATTSAWLLGLVHAWLRAGATERLADLVARLGEVLAGDALLDPAAGRARPSEP